MNRQTQTAAHNVLHRLRQRCSRRLLVAHDSARGRSFGLTHEFLAMMMGVLDRPGLEASACECYNAVKKDLENVYQPA